MWKIWLFFSVFKFIFGAPVDPAEDTATTGDQADLRCLLLASPFASCDDIKRHGNNIPRRLQKLYDKVKKPFVEEKNEELLDSATMDLIPTSLLYLIPRIRLQNMTGHAAGSILRKSPEDEALAVKLSSLLATDADRAAFLEMVSLRQLLYHQNSDLKSDFDTDQEVRQYQLSMEGEPPGTGVVLSEGVERELGRTLAAWYPVGGDWQYWQFDSALTAGNPVLAHLPSYFLNRMAHPVVEKFLFHLRNWRPDYPNTAQVWAQHPNHVKRMWTHTALKKLDRPHLWFPAVVRYAAYLFLGATPDEIPIIVSFINDDSQIVPLLDLNFDPIQSRTLFDVVQKNYTDHLNPKSVRHLLRHLLPRQIPQFDPATITILDQLPPEFDASLPTKAQLLQHQIAHLVYEKELPNVTAASWQDGVKHLGKLVHVLPSSSLEVFREKSLEMATISKISSSSLNFRQSRYLTNDSKLLSLKNPETILSAKNHLKALPAQILNDQNSRVLADNVQRHLLKHIPTKSRALTAALLEKVHLDIDDKLYLMAMLENENHEEMLRFLSSRDLAPRFRSLVSSLNSIALENHALALKIRSLPSNIGAVLLAEFRRDIVDSDEGWTIDNLIENPKTPLIRMLLSNFQCRDMDLVNDVDVVPVLGYYVRERRALGLSFPKNMQYCCQKALTRYLKLKSSLRHWGEDSSGLLNLLELFEVRAVGGYILSSLPLDVIQSALLKNHIIREIGSLPLPELLTATSLSNLRNLAELYGRHTRDLHLREMTELGNLVWFLNFENARRINPGHFRLLLEMKEPKEPKAPCFNAQEREFWRELLVQAMGKPSSWSAGTLSLLGDLLFVFQEEDLETISASSRVDVADVLTKFTNFHRQVEWPGKLSSISYFEACVEALPEAERSSYKSSIRTLLRFYLESAQMVMDTVIPADTLLRLDNDIDLAENEENLAMEVDSDENMSETLTDSRIKRSINTKRGRIFKRVLNQEEPSSAENRKHELLINGSRALVSVFETVIDENNTKVQVSETFPKKSMQISCDAIRMLSMPSSFVLDEDDVNKMTPTELEDCAEVLGSLDLPQNVRKAIWPRLSKWKESNNLLEVGNLVSAMEEDDITSLSLDISEPWTLESLAVLSEHLTHDESLSMVADRFILGNTQIMSSLRFGTAAALGRIVCLITRSRQQKLLDNPSVFVQLAPLLGASEIDDYCIHEMVKYAKTAFGPPSEWSAEDVSSMGIIAAGLTKTDWHNPGLKAEALSGLSPAAVSRIPPVVFKELSEEQLSCLPALSVAAISPAQSSYLSPSQSEVLDRVRRQTPDKDLRATGAASYSTTFGPSRMTTWFVLLTALRTMI